jgi:hypothetical protein
MVYGITVDGKRVGVRARGGWLGEASRPRIDARVLRAFHSFQDTTPPAIAPPPGRAEYEQPMVAGPS